MTDSNEELAQTAESAAAHEVDEMGRHSNGSTRMNGVAKVHRDELAIRDRDS
jgi:hypothetical protein